MTAAIPTPPLAAGWSVNRRAAETVCRHAIDGPDARLLLEVLGLVDAGGTELLPDDRQVVTSELLAIPLSGASPARPRRRPARRTLTADLEDLERTDPQVAAAAASYDRMVERITARPLPEPKTKDDTVTTTARAADPQPIVSLHISERLTIDDLANWTAPAPAPAPVDVLARGLDHPSPRVRKLARTAQTAVDQLVTALLAAR